MLKAIAAALRAGLRSFWNGLTFCWGEGWRVASAPLRIFAAPTPSTLPTPHFEPEVEADQLMADLKRLSNRTAAIRELDRDGLRTVMQYTKSLPVTRQTIDLSGLAKNVRSTLITMDDRELKALAQAGTGAIRKFMVGKDHGIQGVPVVQPIAPNVRTSTQSEAMPYDLLVRRIQARLRDEREPKAFAMPNM